MTVTIQKPSQGRTVIFTDEHGDKYVAFIESYDDAATGPVKGCITLIGIYDTEVFTEVDVPHDNAQSPNTWRFPKHEAETIEVEK